MYVVESVVSEENFIISVTVVFLATRAIAYSVVETINDSTSWYGISPLSKQS